MTAILTALRKFLFNRATPLMRVTRCSDPRTELIARLQASQLSPACVVSGIEHQAAAAIVRTGLPTVEHRRCTLSQDCDEHLFLDVPGQTGVRILACWDKREHRVWMQVAEVGEPRLWDRIVILFTQWERNGRPVPADAVNGTPS